MQCQMLEPTDAEFSASELELLRPRLQTMNVLMVEADEHHMRSEGKQPANWHFVPYKNNLHYVPQLTGRPVAIAEQSGAWPDYPIAEVAQPPRRYAWAPQTLALHNRPVFITYAGFDSRLKGKDRKRPLWQLKVAVRLKHVSCADLHKRA